MSSDLRLDHVAIAVQTIQPALHLFQNTLGGTFLSEGPGDDDDSWRWAQLALPGGGTIELLEPLGEGWLARFLAKRGQGLHHLTLRTQDIHGAMQRISANGYELIDVHLDREGWKDAFMRPSQTYGTLIQIVQIDHQL